MTHDLELPADVDAVIVNGLRFSRDALEFLSSAEKIGAIFRVAAMEGGSLTIERLDSGKHQAARA